MTRNGSQGGKDILLPMPTRKEEIIKKSSEKNDYRICPHNLRDLHA
jgi:hypothetical protein